MKEHREDGSTFRSMAALAADFVPGPPLTPCIPVGILLALARGEC